MLEILAQHPGEVAEIRHDSEAAQLLLEVGLIDKFLKNPNPGRQWYSMAVGICDTHFIVGVLFSDFPNAIDNGYIVHCMPRSFYKEGQVLQWAIDKYNKHCPPESIVQAFAPIVKPENN